MAGHNIARSGKGRALSPLSITVWLLICFSALILISVSFPTTLWPADTKPRVKFSPPGIVSASDIPYPVQGVGGIVGLMVNLDSAGHTMGVDVIRDIPSLTGSALVALNSWTFSPAKLNGKPSAGNLPVNILFNPDGSTSQTVPLLPPVALSQPREPSQFVAPEVLAATYATYPQHTTFSGTVVLEVTVNNLGKAGRVSVIRDVAPLTKPAQAALKKWKFKPAQFNGNPVTSKMIVAFDFRSPNYANH